MIRILILVIVFLVQSFTVSFCTTVKSSLKKIENDSLVRVEPVNEVFLRFLEKVIENEKKCDYYSQDLMFIIQFQTINSQKTIQIESTKDVMKLGNELAGFSLNGHDFLVLGENIDELIFKTTKNKIGIRFFEPSGETQTSSEVVLDVIEDDSFSVWILENNEEFNVIDSFSYCE
jgi:hypothetical protein